MKIGILAEALNADARRSTEIARQNGFAGLLFAAYTPTLSIPDLSQTGRREFNHILAANDLALIGLHADLGPKGFGPGADIDRLISRLDRTIESAAGLRAPLLCLDIGPLAQPIPEIKPISTITPEQAGLLILPPAPKSTIAVAAIPFDQSLADSVSAALTAVASLAERYSVIVAFRSSLSSFIALSHAIQSTRCPWFGIDLDPVAMLEDKWPADEIFSTLGPLIRHTRLRDALRGTDRRTRPAIIGQGTTDWPALLGQLDATGYQGWGTIDPMELTDQPTAAMRGLAHIMRLKR